MNVFAFLLPLAVSAVFVFIASSLVHMALKWHQSDYKPIASDEEVRAAIRKASLAPGQYMLPYCADAKSMNSPDMQAKFIEGPVGLLILRANGTPTMGPLLAKWFGLNVFVALVVALVSAPMLNLSANAHMVFHTTALVTFIAYAGGSISDGIWKAEPGKAVLKNVLDALFYGVVSGLAFAWLWPH